MLILPVMNFAEANKMMYLTAADSKAERLFRRSAFIIGRAG